MRFAKRVMAVALSAAMLVSGLYVGDTASAQSPYTTKKVYISTELVPQDKNISVSEDGSTPVIDTITNVKFTLDCNVDCTWEVDDSAVTDSAKSKFSISDMGVVSIPYGTATGTYVVKANAKNINNTQEKTATCRIKVDGSSNAAKGTITLDKERIEAQYAAYDTEKKQHVEVAADGKSLNVNGTVENLVLYTKVEPEYLCDASVKFSSEAKAAIISGNNLLTTKAESKNVTLTATCGESTETQSFGLTINSREYSASVDCNDIPTGDKDSNNYTIRMNEDLNFKIVDNEKITLPKWDTQSVQWMVRYGNAEVIAEDVCKDKATATVETPLGVFKFTNYGKQVNLLTPMASNTNSDEYKAYIEQLGKSNQITLTPTINYTTATENDSNKDGQQPLAQIVLEFTKEVNSFSKINIDFAAAGLLEGIDYAVKKEKIGSNDNATVYYFESGEKGAANILNLVAATQANVLGVRDFEEARDTAFHGESANYTVTYNLSEITDLDAKYDNDALDKDANEELTTGQGDVKTENRTLTKVGTGYKRLRATITGDVEDSDSCYIRFVSSAAGLSTLHKSYETTDLEYRNKAVIHVRQGEADKPSLYVNGDEATAKAITQYDPFITYTFIPIKGSGTLASYSLNRENGEIKINGLREGKVIVRATSIVDETEYCEYVLYINDEVLQLEQGDLQIDLTDARELGRTDAKGNVQGHYTDIPLKVTTTKADASVPEVIWSVSDESYATITKDGILTTLKSTGSDFVTVRATSAVDKDVYAEQKIYIQDVAASKILTVGEKVAQDGQAAVTASGNNAGTAKAGLSFTLEPKTYEPSNATKVDGGVKWSSKDETVATVDQNGKVTTLAEGTTVISLEYNSASTDVATTTYNLTVAGYVEAVTSISCSDVTLTRVNATDTLVPVVLPATVSDKSVTYDVTTGKDVISVSDMGVVTALKPGKATVKITSNLTPSVSTTITVTVKGEEDNTPGSGFNTPAPTAPQQTPTPTSGVTASKPGKVKLSQAKNVKKKSMKITWKKVSGANGYQVAYGLKKNFKGAKKKVLRKTTLTVKKLKKKKTYYVRVRAYKTVNGKKVYGAWSATKKVKIKK